MTTKNSLKLKIMTQLVDERFEGGLSNNKNDRGGITKYGITKGFYARLKHIQISEVTDETIKGLSKEDAIELYSLYWDSIKCDSVPDTIKHIYFDTCVNSGEYNATKILQRCIASLGINIYIDGRFGPQTIAACKVMVEGYSDDAVIKAYVMKRIQYYNAIVDNDPTQKVFLKGWTNRANWFLENNLLEG